MIHCYNLKGHICPMPFLKKCKIQKNKKTYFLHICVGILLYNSKKVFFFINQKVDVKGLRN